MEAVEVNACLLQKLKKDPDAFLSVSDRVGPVVPWGDRGAPAEGVSQRVAHGVPISGGKAQVLPHLLSFNQFFGVVVLEGKRVFRIRSFVGDLWNIREVGFWHVCYS